MYAVLSRLPNPRSLGYKDFPICTLTNLYMLQKVFSIKIHNKDDMARLEEVVIGLLGGEHHRCAFLRSGEFVRLRTLALYHSSHGVKQSVDSPLHSVHLEGLKITLTPTKTAYVYLTDPCVVPIPPPPTTSSAMGREEEDVVMGTLVGKKRQAVCQPSSESDEEEEQVAEGVLVKDAVPSPEICCDEQGDFLDQVFPDRSGGVLFGGAVGKPWGGL